jgi:hypothetical protein
VDDRWELAEFEDAEEVGVGFVCEVRCSLFCVVGAMHAAKFGFDLFAEFGWVDSCCARAKAEDNEAGLLVVFELDVKETPALLQRA